MIEAARAVFGRGFVGALRGGPRNENRSCCLLLGVFCIVDQTRRLGDVASALSPPRWCSAMLIMRTGSSGKVSVFANGIQQDNKGRAIVLGTMFPFPDIEACC